MKKSNRYRDHIDPEYRRWSRVYPRFPGVAECVRLIQSRKAKGAWVDIVVYELAENAENCLEELIQAFRENQTDQVAKIVLMAIELAKLPASIPFLSQVLREDDPNLAHYARRALQDIDTRESRTALHIALNSQRPLPLPLRCPCCGCRTLEGRGDYDICPVCLWEDDGQDEHDAEVLRGGPNGSLSLSQARANFLRCGACEDRFIGNVRAPHAEELPQS